MQATILQESTKFISQDLFKQGGRWYSVTVDHYSDWFEVDLLNEDITAANVISVTKAHFVRYGIPDTFLSSMIVTVVKSWVTAKSWAR